MRNVMDALYDFVCENTPSLRHDPEYQQTVKAYTEIEEEVKEKIGDDLLYKYQRAERAVSRLWELAIVRQTLRISCRFMLEILR